ncbi:MAG: hypothetical protein WC770_03435 [Phycisphaerae bacterium]|jgi:hypothetical protein
MADNTTKRMECRDARPCVCTDFRQLFFIASLCVVSLFVFAGCEKKAAIKTEKQDKPVLSPTSIKQENAQLKAENEQLKKQVETLAGIDKAVRIDAISTVSAIELTNRSGIRAKKDSNDVNESLIVYVRTIDDMGDVVKAPGQVKVELWDLNTKPAEALLGSWTVEPAKLKKSWSGSIMTNYYKLTFDVGAIPKDKKRQELTLKAQFTDYISGKILKAQKVIK